MNNSLKIKLVDSKPLEIRSAKEKSLTLRGEGTLIKGQPGFSPVIDFERVKDGILMTVQNEDSKKEILIRDGIPGEKGDDYILTEQDKIDIAEKIKSIVKNMNIIPLAENQYDENGVPTINNPQSSTIYLVPSSNNEVNDIWNEWIYVENSWEKFGSTILDISSYATKAELSEAIREIELLPGPKGDKGDTGEAGPQGIQGPKGDKGDVGEQGIQGPKGETGETGDKGDKGDTGEQGPKGDKGDKGDPFVFSDFTEEQLELLKGEPGKDGVNGKDGIDGKDGINGIDGINGKDGKDGPTINDVLNAVNLSKRYLDKNNTGTEYLQGRIQIGDSTTNIANALLHVRRVTSSITGAAVNGACFSVNADGTASFQHKTYNDNGGGAKNTAVLRFSNRGIQFATNTGSANVPTEEMYKELATQEYVDLKIQTAIANLLNGTSTLNLDEDEDDNDSSNIVSSGENNYDEP